MAGGYQKGKGSSLSCFTDVKVPKPKSESMAPSKWKTEDSVKVGKDLKAGGGKGK